jgi:hypothetical protein
MPGFLTGARTVWHPQVAMFRWILNYDTGEGMGDRQLRRRCVRLADSLDIPIPFSLETLCAGLGIKRNRPIHLVPWMLPPGGPSGLLLGTGQADHVFYDWRARPLHRDHIVLHELGHVVWGHEIAVAGEAAAARRLLPRLSPELVRRMLFRSQFSDAEERQAEVFASVMLERFSYQQVVC